MRAGVRPAGAEHALQLPPLTIRAMPARLALLQEASMLRSEQRSLQAALSEAQAEAQALAAELAQFKQLAG